MTVFDKFCQVAASCEGYAINRLFMARIEESDSLEIGLTWGPEKPDITLSFQNIYYFEVASEADREIVDRVATAILEPSDGPWPKELNVDLVRSATLPTLMWFRMIGIAQLSVLAPLAIAHIEMR